jgi:hypothetical protein
LTLLYRCVYARADTLHPHGDDTTTVISTVGEGGTQRMTTAVCEAEVMIDMATAPARLPQPTNHRGRRVTRSGRRRRRRRRRRSTSERRKDLDMKRVVMTMTTHHRRRPLSRRSR